MRPNLRPPGVTPGRRHPERASSCKDTPGPARPWRGPRGERPCCLGPAGWERRGPAGRAPRLLAAPPQGSLWLSPHAGAGAHADLTEARGCSGAAVPRASTRLDVTVGRMPSANLGKHHASSPPQPGFLCLKCIKFWRLLRPLGPERLRAGEGVAWRGVGGSRAGDQRLTDEPGGSRLDARTSREWPAAPGSPRPGPRLRFSPNRRECLRTAPELAKVTPKRHLFLGGSREGRASAPTQHIFLSVNSDV